jgi:hypothetical protein
MCWRRYALDSRASRFVGRSLAGSVTRRGYHAARGDGVTRVGSDAIALARARALGFVEARGDELARRRARSLASRVGSEPVVEWLARLQLSDGGFPAALAPGAPPSLEAARSALAALADLGALVGPVVERAAEGLRRAQRADGSWVPEGDGSEAAALEATGRIAGLLARSRCARPRSLDAAAEWLAARFAPERVQGFAWGPLAAYAATFANVPHDVGDAILQWCGRELERGFRSGAFTAVRTARVLLDSDAASLPGARFGPREVGQALLREQADDGGWPPFDAGDPARIATALDALAGLALAR